MASQYQARIAISGLALPQAHVTVLCTMPKPLPSHHGPLASGEAALSCSGSRFSASEFSKPIASGNRTEEDHAGKSMSVGGRTLFCRRSGGSDRRAWRSRQRPIRRAATTMPDWRLADGRGSGGHGGESDGQTQDPVGRHPYRPSHWFGSSVRCRSHRPGPARAGKAPRIDMIWAPRPAIRARWLSDDFANSRLAR